MRTNTSSLPGPAHRIMGIETEYGIAQPGSRNENPMILSSQIVNAYANIANSSRRRARWDYEEESPLRDARGYELDRDLADPSQLTDMDMGFANVILANGSRYYVDHAHPEYSGPECTNPLDVVLWDAAGDEILRRSMAAAAEQYGPLPINIYKNNTDNKGASYGTHENYIVSRSISFATLIKSLTPFFVTRQIMVGAGRVGLGQTGHKPGFQMSQRADFFESEVGLETTLNRPIINTRDEPHADASLYRRLHVIIGDANLSQPSTFLKLGTTAIILSMIEKEFLESVPQFRHPVESLRAISHDYRFRHTYEMVDGHRMSAIDVQEFFLEKAESFSRLTSCNDPQTHQVLTQWRRTIDGLRKDSSELSRTVEWIAKLEILESYRSRESLYWSHAKLQLVDLQWADLRPQKSIFQRLVDNNRHQVLCSQDEINQAVAGPPSDTRAFFRGSIVSKYPHEVVAASWDALVIEIHPDQPLVRIPLTDPYRGTREDVGHLLTDTASVQELVERIRTSELGKP